MRGLLVIAGVASTAVGLTVTFTTWTVNGWTVIALVGWCVASAASHIPAEEVSS